MAAASPKPATSELWRGLPVLLAGLVLSAAGECLGYALDVDVAPLRVDTALDRLQYVRREDRRHELDESNWPAAPASRTDAAGRSESSRG